MRDADLGAARVGRLRTALERVREVATKADLSAFVVENGPIVVDVHHIESLLEIVIDALNDDALTRDRPTAADLRATMNAAVKADQALAQGHR